MIEPNQYRPHRPLGPGEDLLSGTFNPSFPHLLTLSALSISFSQSIDLGGKPHEVGSLSETAMAHTKITRTVDINLV